MKKPLALLLLFGIVGCNQKQDYSYNIINLSCSCIEGASSGDMCDASKGGVLIVNKKEMIMDISNIYGYGKELPLTIEIDSYTSGDFSLNRSSLVFNHSYGKYIDGGKVINNYQCSEIKI